MINQIRLSNFRNFEKNDFKFTRGINVINAPNASGKTNILESIFLISTGKSFKAKKEQETINYNKDISSIEASVEDLKLEVKITTGENGWPKKRLLVNGVPRRLIDFAGNLKVTLFAPQDLELVTDSPTVRRKFLDTVLSQADREYRRSIGSYEKGIRQRNRLLFRIREEGISRSNLLFWDQLLIKNGDYIYQKRREFLDFCNSYKSPVASNYSVLYDPSAISEGRLEQYKNEEIASATTLVGPHRDDFEFLMTNKSDTKENINLSAYGSRGEQRMAILWLKLAELAFIEEKTGVKPTLLLDDIFSELDHMHREVVMKTVDNHQVIITSADEHNLPNLKDVDINIIDL